MLLFTGAPGRVIAMDDPTTQGLMPALVDVNTGDLNFQSQKSLITSITLQYDTNHQFLHTLGGDIYLYVFGDRISPMLIGGLMAAYDCDQPDDTQYGVEKMLAWYNANKLSVSPTPLNIMIGRTALSGFLAGFQASMLEPKLNLMQFQLSLFVPPND